SQRYVLWFATDRLIWNTHTPCGMSASMPVERDYTSEVKYIYTLKWSSTLHPQHYWLPRQLFDCTGFSTAIVTTGASGSPVDIEFEATYEMASPDAGIICLLAVT